MATGARDVLGATWAVSTTGVAGPTEQEGQPVGTVFLGIAGPGGLTVSELALDGDRTRSARRPACWRWTRCWRWWGRPQEPARAMLPPWEPTNDF